jgi:hypothetical protein
VGAAVTGVFSSETTDSSGTMMETLQLGQEIGVPAQTGSHEIIWPQFGHGNLYSLIEFSVYWTLKQTVWILLFFLINFQGQCFQFVAFQQAVTIRVAHAALFYEVGQPRTTNP